MNRYLQLLALIFFGILAYAQPAITSFSPLSGAAGTSVTISGSGFNTTSGQNVVFVGSCKATVTSASATSLTITLPAASSGNAYIKVLNLSTNEVAVSSRIFTYTFAGGIASSSVISGQFPTAKTMTGPSLSGEGSTVFASSSMAAGDYDGDGKLDFCARAAVGSNSITVFQNVGSAHAILTSSTFSSRATYTLQANSYYIHPYAEDMNNDGKLDIIVAHSTGFTIFENTSTGIGNFSFTARNFNVSTNSSTKLCVADLDMDGLLDIACIDNATLSSSISIYINTTASSTTNFNTTPTNVSNPERLGDIISADLDNDGDMDIVVSSSNGSSNQSIYYIENTTTTPGTLSMASATSIYGVLPVGSYGGHPVSINAADFDNDGDLDIVSVSKGTSNTAVPLVYVHRNDGSLTFTSFSIASSFSSTNNITRTVRIGDINGDGKVDIIFGNQNVGGNFAILNNYSTGALSSSHFSSHSGFSVSDMSWGYLLEDFNQDGRVDLLSSHYYNATIHLQTNTISAFHCKSSGDLALVANWGVDPNGTGTAPVSLTSSNTNYILANRSAYSLSSDATFSFLALEPGKSLDVGTNNLQAGAILGYDSSTYIKTSSSGTLKMGVPNSTSVTFPVGNSAFNPATITNNTGTADDFAVRVLDEVYDAGTTGSVMTGARVKRTWDIDKTTSNSSSGIDFVFNWNTSEAVNVSVPALYHYGASGWSQQTSGTTSFSGTSLTYTGYTGTFSPFTVGDASAALPVELIYFEAKPLGDGQAILNWQTASELNNNYFDVERSYDATYWELIGKVKGKGTTSQVSDYSFVDSSLSKNRQTAYYRINQIDFDGANEYTDIRYVRLSSAPYALEIAAYPNPFTQEVSLSINATQPYSIEVSDINGLVTLTIEQNSVGTHRLDVSEWATGVYIVKVTSAQGTKHLKLLKK